MRKLKKLFIPIFTVILHQTQLFAGDVMDQARMEAIIKGVAEQAQGGKGVVEFVYDKLKMVVISDVTHDRMRIISAVNDYRTVTREQLDLMMESNFHKALDARYCVSNGILYSAYLHPLSTLTESQIKSAVQQVANLVTSFGNDYSSGFLSFGNQ